MKQILVTGACGQIGSELVVALGKRFGPEKVIATDIQKPTAMVRKFSHFKYLNVLDAHMTAKLVVENDIDTIFHMAAILSAYGEQNPQMAYEVNLQGLMNILEVARRKSVEKVLAPSTIAVFGSDAPKDKTPDDVALNPSTMYGVTKVAGEKLMQYYHHKYGIDTRSLRYPGIISAETLPGGGTTDFAVEMYIAASQKQKCTSFIAQQTPLPFMYMPDAIKAILDLADAPANQLSRRNYNVHALSLTPAQITESIQKYTPGFNCDYKPDFRQQIAESWPHSIDDSNARKDWGWQPDFSLDAMTRDMLERLTRKSMV
ncbi:MAG: NAD-dependent epimerase/dehydratase family protein [Calditrichia bacterium]|nr:NAD-dependent epimerase/dehydratase family protein [Calditrichota bacterium]MCB0287297.1 NAD-dependent epimerase/dehydratase family protein [Calditrichota bacterium]MCB9068991.1 NAD-dependent epimerase/dehydratase family protein [Calditrichia bacterium]